MVVSLCPVLQKDVLQLGKQSVHISPAFGKEILICCPVIRLYVLLFSENGFTSIVPELGHLQFKTPPEEHCSLRGGVR